VSWWGVSLAVVALFATAARAESIPEEQAKQQGQDANEKILDAKRKADHRALVTRIRAAGTSFEAIDADDIANVRSKLCKSMHRLDDCLKRNLKHGEVWRTFLHWNDLDSQLNTSAIPNLELLRGVERQFNLGYAGLELPTFRRVVEDLHVYCQIVRASRIVDQSGVVQSELERLATALEKAETRLRRRTYKQIGTSLAWFDRYGFSPKLMEDVRQHYVRPNFYAHVSRGLLAAGFQRPLREDIPIDEMSGGAHITGTGTFAGTMTLQLIPDNTRASIRLCLDGTFHTSTCGSRHPVGFSTWGMTRIGGEQYLSVTGDGMRSTPANVDALTSLHITNVWSNFSRPLKNRVATRIGWRKVSEGKASSERRLSLKAEEMFTQRFENESHEMVTAINEAIVDSIRVPLKQNNIYPRELAFRTTRHCLHVRAVQAGPAQLAAFSPPPESFTQAAMSFSVHESLINNTVATTLSGETIESHQLADVIERIAGEVPEEFTNHDGATWSLTLYGSNPLEVHFADGGPRIKIRCRRITAGDQQYNVPFDVTADYKGSIRDDAVVFTRAGGVIMRSPGINALGKLNDEQARARAAIQQRFEMLLGEEMKFSFAQFPVDMPPGIELVPSEYRSVDGWMTVALKMKPLLSK